MKLWQKTYLLSALLCTLILYGCMFGVSAPAIASTTRSAFEAALREEKAIAGALERTLQETDQSRHKTVVTTFLDYYGGRELFFSVKRGEEEVYETLPFPVQRVTGTAGFFHQEGKLFLFVSDRLPSGDDLLYVKGAQEVQSMLHRQVTTAAFTGTLVALFMAGALYALLYRVNLPVSQLAHEMRTPLTAMRGYAETLRDARLTEEQRYMAAAYIAQESKRLSDVSSRLLTIHSAREESSPFAPVSVAELFDHIRQTYPTVTYEISWPTVFGDGAMLSSLLNNLVDNAVKASPAGAPVELRAAPNVIAVLDHGRGMTEAELKYVNHPSRFQRLHAAGGLGVPLCHEIAKAHGAKLTYTRGADGGTVATLTFYNSLTS